MFQIKTVQVMLYKDQHQHIIPLYLINGIMLLFQEVETLGQYSQMEQQQHHQQVVSLLFLQMQTIR